MHKKSYIKQFFAFLWAWFAIFILIDLWRGIFNRHYTLLVLIISAFGYIIALVYLLDLLRTKKE